MIVIGADNHNEFIDRSAEAVESEKACAIAPVLRMCYAAAFCGDGAATGVGAGSSNGVGVGPGCGFNAGHSNGVGASGGCPSVNGILPGGAAASTVIYLGRPQTNDNNEPVRYDPPARSGRNVLIIKLPDEIYADTGKPISDNDVAAIKSAFAGEYAKRGRVPLPVYIDGIGTFVCGRTIADALAGAGSLLPGGGAGYEGRHAEAIRQTHNICKPGNDGDARTKGGDNPAGLPLCKLPGNRLDGKITLITGAAQGFGKGIAAELAAEGAYVAVADLNYDGAKNCAAELNDIYGAGRAIAVAANVADETSVAAMVRETVLSYGGLDLFISNAGVLIAGALPDMTKRQFDLVTSVNYTGYFLGVKYASAPMIAQRSVLESYMTDIIEIISKSGLEGSNKNFAYAGSKFGGVGLTQSFALELVEYGVKVNAICPGNFLDGPLWSDPDKGLFKQYLDAGKVPGAKTVADVRRYYESRVPMKRGCTVRDVVRSIFYLVEQEYETGQALPVTGGQVMLR